MPLLHDLGDFSDLIIVVAADIKIDSGLVEKDYWIMHALWGLQQLGFQFELKGGTSLSKGYHLIHRFSEDIDILIHPQGALPIGRNHDKPVHIEQRREFFDGLVAIGALSAGLIADRFGLSATIASIAALTLVSGAVVAVLMREHAASALDLAQAAWRISEAE